MGEFRGFGKDALGFFRALEFHQNKAWFDQNRAVYDDQIVAPLTALLDDLTATFAKKKVALRADGKRSIFRIHRDVRFSRDKSPYKTHAGAVMTQGGGKSEDGVLYIHLDPKGCFIAAGFHMPAPPALALLRGAIARGGGRAYLKVEKTLATDGLTLTAGEQLSRVPRGFEALKGGPLDAAIRRKSFLVEEPVSERDLASNKLPDKIAAFAGRALPLLTFGWAALG